LVWRTSARAKRAIIPGSSRESDSSYFWASWAAELPLVDWQSSLPEDTVQIPTLASARRFFVHGSIKKWDLPKYPERTSKLVAFMDVELASILNVYILGMPGEFDTHPVSASAVFISQINTVLLTRFGYHRRGILE
jgi:hypothetical protein